MREQVERIKNRDQAACRSLYDRFSGPMFNLCLRLTNNTEDAHDALQESFIRIFEGIGNLQQPELLPAWIKRICINTSLGLMKARRKMNFEDIEQQPYMLNLQDESEFLSESDHALNIELIQEGIRQLPDRYRIVFTMHALEDYSHEEIASALGIVAGTSRSQYLRAKQKLIDWIQKNKNHVRPSERIYSKIKTGL